MRSSKRRLAAILTVTAFTATALTGAGAAPAGAGNKKPPPPKPKMVTVADFYYGPEAVTLKKGGSILWKWSPANSQPHDVHLKTGPKGLKNKASYSTKTSAVTNAQFKKTFDTVGSYKFLCTIHPTEMKMSVTVKK